MTTLAAGETCEGEARTDSAWLEQKFQELEVGTLDINEAGERAVAIRPSDPQTWKAINLRQVTLAPAGK